MPTKTESFRKTNFDWIFLPGATSIGLKLLLHFCDTFAEKDQSTKLNIFLTAFQIQRFRKNAFR